MKIFSLKVRIDKNSVVEYFFDMELIQQNRSVELIELDGYYETPYEHPSILIRGLVATLQNWQKLLNNFSDNGKLFLTIGMWDEYITGFYIVNEKNYFNLKYGYIAAYVSGGQEYLHNMDESILHVEYDFESTKEEFLQDIRDNICYLEREISLSLK